MTLEVSKEELFDNYEEIIDAIVSKDLIINIKDNVSNKTFVLMDSEIYKSLLDNSNVINHS